MEYQSSQKWAQMGSCGNHMERISCYHPGLETPTMCRTMFKEQIFKSGPRPTSSCTHPIVLHALKPVDIWSIPQAIRFKMSLLQSSGFLSLCPIRGS